VSNDTDLTKINYRPVMVVLVCDWTAKNSEIERLRAENTELVRIMRKVHEDGHTDCVADADPLAGRCGCDVICSKVWQMCAGCQLRVTLQDKEADR